MISKILTYFRTLKLNRRIAGSYLFIGRDFSLVKEIIKILLCQYDSCNNCWDCNAIEKEIHPDLFIVEQKNLNINIDSIREIQRFLSLKSFRSNYKIVLIRNSENLNLESSNALLKTLEEPPDNSFIALCATKLDTILSTISSRCKKIFLPIFEEDVKFDDSLFLSFLNGKRLLFKNRIEFSSFLYSVATLINKFIVFKLTNRSLTYYNKDILYALENFSIKHLIKFLDEILKIYNLYNNINENLALNLLRLKLYEDSNNQIR